MRNIYIFILLIIFFTTSCAKKEETDDSSDTTTASGTNGTYEGTWSKTCTQNGIHINWKSSKSDFLNKYISNNGFIGKLVRAYYSQQN